MKTIIKTLLFCFLSFNAIAQELLDLEQFGFSAEVPKGWFKTENNDLLENIDRFDLTEAQLDAMLTSFNTAKQFIALHKYEPETRRGIIPTINISIRSTSYKSFGSFKTKIERAGEQFKKLFKNFETQPPHVIDLNGTKVWTTKATYDFKDPAGADVKLHSEIIYIYKGKYYISVNFIEEDGKEDNSAVFENLIKTIKLTNVTLKK
jgi:hypothetical protein